jgi:hypothetical protein
MRRAIPYGIIVIVLGLAIWLGSAIIRQKKLEKEFSRVVEGTTQQEVVHLLGKPTKVEKCGDSLGSLPKDRKMGCGSEYLYTSPFAPLLWPYYVVRFDDTGRVLETLASNSP